MTYRSQVLSLLLIFLTGIFANSWGVPEAGATDAAELVVKLGQGQAAVLPYGFELSDEARRKLETDLMTDRNLADRVISSATTEVRIAGQALAGIEQKLINDLEGATQELAGLVRLQILGSARRGDQSPKGTEVGDENRRVVVGGRFELKKGESLEELVVLGGQAEIHGTVARLSTMGGRVHIYESAQVTDELINLGGEVIIDQGAQIQHQPYEVTTPFDDSFKMFWESHNQVAPWEIFKSPMWLWGFRIFKLLTFWVVALVFVLLAPDFFSQVKDQLMKSPGESVGFGLAACAGYVPVAVALVITIVGISLLPVQALVYFYALVVGCVAVVVGLLTRVGLAPRPIWLQVTLAVGGLEALGWIPYLGSLTHVIVSLAGLGAVFAVLWRRVWKKRSVSEAPLTASH